MILRDNPVLVKEMRSRMRNARAQWAMLGYSGLLTAAFVIVYKAVTESGVPQPASVGSNYFYTMSIMQTIFAALLAPAFTANAFTVEREQQTFDLLISSLAPPAAIVAGKIIAALSHFALLLVTSLPFVGICFLFGGVSPEEMIAAYLVIALTGTFLGTAGLCVSSFMRRTVAANGLTAVVVLLVLAGTPLIEVVYEIFSHSPSAGSEIGAMVINPIVAVISVWDSSSGMTVAGIPVWMIATPVYAVLTVLFLWLAARNVRP